MCSIVVNPFEGRPGSWFSKKMAFSMWISYTVKAYFALDVTTTWTPDCLCNAVAQLPWCHCKYPGLVLLKHSLEEAYPWCIYEAASIPQERCL